MIDPTNQTIDPQLKEVANGHKHSNYDYTVEYSKNLKQIITGRDIEQQLKQFIPNEDEATFKQRKNITQQITPSVSKNLMDVYMKVPRSTSAIKILAYPKEDLKPKFEQILNEFNGNKSFDDFCSSVFIRKNWIDPNGFCVIEWKRADTTKEHLKPYPFIVSSEMAIDYEYENNVLLYLVVKQEKNNLIRYTVYYPSHCVIWQQVKEIEGQAKQTEGEIFKTTEGEFIKVVNSTYQIIKPLPEYNLSQVPAFRFGGVDSDAYEGTSDSLIQPCLPYLKKSIKSVSEMDLTQALHCFPQKFIYAPPCPKCKGMTPDIDTCSHCGHTGMDLHTSAASVISLKLPREVNKDLMVDLSTLIHYEYPPIDGIKWQDEYINSLTAKCKETLFNTDIYSRQEIAETATGKNISLQNVYDTLYPFALHYSDFWEWVIKLIAEITQIKVFATLKFSKDFKFKTKDDYIAELKSAKDAGASPSIIENIQTEIVKIDSEENQDAMLVYYTQQRYYPFRDKNDSQIAMLLAKLPLTNYYVTLWTYFGEIFEQIEQENRAKVNEKGEITTEGFYKLNVESQNAIVETKVKEFIELNKVTVPQFPTI